MPNINKVGHVVLNVRDPEASAKWYSETLGMEVMALNSERHMAFLSFGSQHHDIALFKAPEGSELTPLGLNHVALQIQGGEQELAQLYGRLVNMGVKVTRTSDHGISYSVYFQDPDGITLEIFCETMTPDEGMNYMRTIGGSIKPLALEPITT